MGQNYSSLSFAVIIGDLECRHPRAGQMRGLGIAGPRRHRDADEFQGGWPRAAVLKRRTDGDVDGGAGHKRGHFFNCPRFAPNLAFPFQHMPKFRNCRVDRRAVDLLWRNRAVNHVSGRPVHYEADVGPGGRFCIRNGGK